MLTVALDRLVGLWSPSGVGVGENATFGKRMVRGVDFLASQFDFSCSSPSGASNPQLRYLLSQ